MIGGVLPACSDVGENSVRDLLIASITETNSGLVSHTAEARRQVARQWRFVG